jgi:hypothetical protein
MLLLGCLVVDSSILIRRFMSNILLSTLRV